MSDTTRYNINDQGNRDQDNIEPGTDAVERDLKAYEYDSDDGYKGDDEHDARRFHETNSDEYSDDEEAGDLRVEDGGCEVDRDYGGNEGSSELGEIVDEGYEGDDETDTFADDGPSA